MTERPDPVILDADGQPARPASRRCPVCGAGPDRRRRSGGFGAVHDVCGDCGYAFDERTVEPPPPRSRRG